MKRADPDSSPELRLAELTRIEAGWLQRAAPTGAGGRLLWIGIAAPALEELPAALHSTFVVAESGEFGGDVRGQVEALPFAPGSASHVVVQHAHEVAADGDDLLVQCAGLLKPAGVLLVFGFHPWSMWQRQIQAGSSLRVRTPQAWGRALIAEGLDVRSVERVGPAWPGAPGIFDRFGMAYALRASHGGAAIIPLTGRLRKHAPGSGGLSLATRNSATLRRVSQ